MRIGKLPLLALVFVSGCSGCGKSSVEPRRYIGKDAESVLEVRDLQLLVRTRLKLLSSFGRVVTAPQIEALQKELELRFGFDPSTPEGLAAAGLPPSGSIAAELKGSGSSALWVVPVADSGKVAATIEKIVRARGSVEEVTKVSEGGHELTAFVTSFGPEKITLAIYAIKDGVALVGAGPEGKTMVLAALDRKAEDAVTQHPEYQAQEQALGKTWEVRLISPSGAAALKGAIKAASRALPIKGLEEHPDLVHLTSAGWALDFSGGAAKVQGKLRLDAEGQKRANELFATKGPVGAGVLAADLPRAVVYAQLGGNPSALLATVAPAGGPVRTSLDNLFARLKSDLQTDVEAEILPLFSGHGAISVGVGDLTGRPLEAMMQNPMAFLWSSFAIGTAAPGKLAEVERRIDPGLTSRGLTITSRESGGAKVRSVVQEVNGQKAVLVESFERPGAMIWVNEPEVTDQLVQNQSGLDHLGGKPGIAIDVRFGELSRSLGKLDIASMPIFVRSMVAKIIEAIATLDTLSIWIKSVPDGIGLEASLSAHFGTQQ